MELWGDESRQRDLVRQAFAKLPAFEIDLGDAWRCQGCGRKCETFLESLKKCTGCGKAWYHSPGLSAPALETTQPELSRQPYCSERTCRALVYWQWYWRELRVKGGL
ncbi:hypothetical protein CTRI78_v002068 [Colletotrichum trifolii]|uniref:Uncharacterized protein n=1 Tax=Colletotrichum trifolii TaxID=5466 RepID=A0A4R8RXZ7_COLTR|nr:hypothetical protein CTRI78_v002068 [Colletotrichum trifolii]